MIDENETDYVSIDIKDEIKFQYNENGLEMTIKIPSQLLDMVNEKIVKFMREYISQPTVLILGRAHSRFVPELLITNQVYKKYNLTPPSLFNMIVIPSELDDVIEVF